MPAIHLADSRDAAGCGCGVHDYVFVYVCRVFMHDTCACACVCVCVRAFVYVCMYVCMCMCQAQLDAPDQHFIHTSESLWLNIPAPRVPAQERDAYTLSWDIYTQLVQEGARVRDSDRRFHSTMFEDICLVHNSIAQ